FRVFGFRPKIGPKDIGEDAFEKMKPEDMSDILREQVMSGYREKENLFGKDELEHVERLIILQIIDNQWIAHLQDMDHMKEGIGLRGYGHLDPLKEYQKEGFALFGELMDRIRAESLGMLFRIQIARRPETIPESKKRRMNLSRGDDSAVAPFKRKERKIGRNDPCPCGSGKKYKKCCGINA
ncbi:MAG TPA: preprotein translocase subunit SecA, partial [Desulfobacteraceae bacterium]|nr:preprotein translocase subunit SecA [Desulfobacteraceae bacterium]